MDRCWDPLFERTPFEVGLSWIVDLPHGLVLPIAHAAEAWARLTGGAEPFVTVDGLRMSKKRMFFTSAKAETALGYRARPAEAALADAVAWFREAGYLG